MRLWLGLGDAAEVDKLAEETLDEGRADGCRSAPRGVPAVLEAADRAQRPSSVPKAGATGLEPATSAVTGQRSNQLSYAPALYAGISA